jgi:hypothetical protein
LIAENALKLTNAYPYFKKFCMDKQPGSIKCFNLIPKSHKNSSVSMYNVKNFPGASPRPPFTGEGKEGREGKGEKEKRGEGSIPK